MTQNRVDEPAGSPYLPRPHPKPTTAMRTKRKFMKTRMTRPRKGGAARNRRQLEHRRRLIALGVDEETVNKMTPLEVRTMLKYPAKVATEQQ